MDAVKHHDPASLWVPRRQMTLAEARKRSDIVRNLRVLFMACATVSIGLFLGYIIKSALTRDAVPLQISGDEVVTMLNPRFAGRDSTGQSFTITADAARRKELMANAVDLVGPILRDAAGSEVRAPSGMYDRDAGILELYDDVVITDMSGYSFKTAAARVHVGQNWVEGLSPLQGKGPLGDIRSDSYEILDGGNRVVFLGNVKTVIYPAEPDVPVADEGGADGNP
jgi:lipopolysaccharide export system protein LptC